MALHFFRPGYNWDNFHNIVVIYRLEHHEFRERVVKPRLKYVYPVMSYNTFEIDRKQLGELFANSKKESLIVSLAVELGLGGVYSEEICLLSDVDKSQNPRDTNEKQIQSILNSIKKIINKKIEAQAVFHSGNLIDATPFAFEFYKNN